MLNDGKEVCGIGYWAGSFSFATHPPPFGLRGGGDAPPRNLEKLLAPCAGEDKNSWCMFCPIFQKKILKVRKSCGKVFAHKESVRLFLPWRFQPTPPYGGWEWSGPLDNLGGGSSHSFSSQEPFFQPSIPSIGKFSSFCSRTKGGWTPQFFLAFGVQKYSTNGHKWFGKGCKGVDFF